MLWGFFVLRDEVYVSTSEMIGDTRGNVADKG